jgi:hypothetical protein
MLFAEIFGDLKVQMRVRVRVCPKDFQACLGNRPKSSACEFMKRTNKVFKQMQIQDCMQSFWFPFTVFFWITVLPDRLAQIVGIQCLFLLE